MKQWAAIFLTFFATSTFAADTNSAQGSPVVTVAAGGIRGDIRPDGTEVFKGIPYAAAPIGRLRWTAPVAASSWQGVRSAQAFGAPCLQLDQKWNSESASASNEDCLFLNVWAPEHKKTAGLPVMVWIHGGGFTGGAGDALDADGGKLASRGVILVTLNYRLGLLGFFAHPGVADGGNFGLLDQIAALHWVKTNIAQFGGDPANITIFGQSAGGIAIQSLLASPMVKGLAQRAIIESGVVDQLPTLKKAQALDTARRFANGDTMDQLRALSASEIMKRYAAFSPQVMVDIHDQFLPFVDGVVLPDDPQLAFKSGKQLRVPLIIGNNAREGVAPPSDTNLIAQLHKTYGADATAAIHEYGLDVPEPHAPDAVMGSAGAAFATDTMFRCEAARVAGWHAAIGAQTYQYQFEQPLPGREASGTVHGDEIPYVFGNLLPNGPKGGKFGPADRALSDVLVAYWTNFAKSGNPNGPGLPVWPAYDADGRNFAHFANRFASGVKLDHALRSTACSLYERSRENMP